MPTNKYATPGNFLKTISQLESSGGKNINGPVVQHGIQAGTSAIGQYQMMPNTVKEIINRRRQAGTITQEMQDLDGMNPHEMKEHIEANPELEQELAESLATKVLQNQMGDEDKAAFAWHQGHNLKPEEISTQKLNNMDSVGGQYVDRFRRIKDQMAQPQPDEADQDSDTQDDGADDASE